MTSDDADAVDAELYGSWRIVSTKGVLVEPDGTRTESENVQEGVIVFTPQHRMIAFSLHPGRKYGSQDAS